MTRRLAVTLIEVLVTLFIMAIGMLALMTLFPLGALSMAQALKDDRCASTAAMAENVALAMNIRHDPAVLANFTGPSSLVYVDPVGTTNGLVSKLGGVIPRVPPSFITAAPMPLFAADRWFSLPDDITFLENGTPDTSSGFIDRGRRYSYAYLLRQLSSNLVQLYVVVYSGRSVNTLTPETPLAATVLGVNGLQLAGAAGMPIKRGGWVLDPVNGYFYRVTNLADVGGGNMAIDVQPNLVGAPAQVVVLDYVAEVFDKGTGWQP